MKMINGGEGGIIVTDNRDVAFKAMLYAGCYEHNREKHFGTDEDEQLKEMTSSIPTYNFRMSNLSAAVLLPQLDDVEERVAYLNKKYEKLMGILACEYTKDLLQRTIDMRLWLHLSIEEIEHLGNEVLSAI